MKIEDALKLLGLKSSSSTADLNSSFRKRAKQFHPDFNPGREQWAHQRMIELNLAYEKALEYFTSLTADAEPFAEPSRDVSFIVKFNRAFNLVLDAVYLYYQYGLENVHLRRQGVRKFRYRDAVKNMKSAIDLLEVLIPFAAEGPQSENLRTIIDFSRGFLQNMFIDRPFVPTGNATEAYAHRHYQEGSNLLDYAIKDAFFGDRLIQVRTGSYYSKISKGYQELTRVIVKYYESSWIAETIIKIYLLEVFTKVIKLLKQMRY
jgi:hypothetical protein